MVVDYYEKLARDPKRMELRASRLQAMIDKQLSIDRERTDKGLRKAYDAIGKRKYKQASYVHKPNFEIFYNWRAKQKRWRAEAEATELIDDTSPPVKPDSITPIPQIKPSELVKLYIVEWVVVTLIPIIILVIVSQL
jgi:hypothetical protein